MPVIGLFYATIVISSRIRRFVTAAYEVLNDNGVTVIGFFNIHSNIALDTTTGIVTAIDILQDSTGNGQMYITVDMGIIGAAVDIFYRFTRRTCCQDDVYSAYITCISCTIKSCNPQRACT